MAQPAGTPLRIKRRALRVAMAIGPDAGLRAALTLKGIIGGRGAVARDADDRAVLARQILRRGAVAAFAEEGDASGDSPTAGGSAPSGPNRNVDGTSAGRGERSRFGPSDARRSGSDAALDLSDRGAAREDSIAGSETADAPGERAPSAGLAAHGGRAREDCARDAPGGLK